MDPNNTMNVLVEIPEEDKMFTVAVERQAKIEDLCLELAQSLGLTSKSHVTLIYEGQPLNPKLTFSQAEIPKGAKLVVKKHVDGGSELIRK